MFVAIALTQYDLNLKLDNFTLPLALNTARLHRGCEAMLLTYLSLQKTIIPQLMSPETSGCACRQMWTFM